MVDVPFGPGNQRIEQQIGTTLSSHSVETSFAELSLPLTGKVLSQGQLFIRQLKIGLDHLKQQVFRQWAIFAT